MYIFTTTNSPTLKHLLLLKQIEIKTQGESANFIAFDPPLAQIFMQSMKIQFIKGFLCKGFKLSNIRSQLGHLLELLNQS